jgi:hypothetical protein
MTHCKLAKAFLISIFAISVFAGCNKKESILKVNEDEWPLFKVAGEGFSLRLPPNWRRENVDQSLIKKGAKFVGIDESSIKTGFTSNANVTLSPNPRKITDLDVLVALHLKEMWEERAIKGTIDHKRLNLPTGDCERFNFKAIVYTPHMGDTLCSFTSFSFLRGSENYILTLTTLPGKEQYYAPIFQKIGESFQFDK